MLSTVKLETIRHSVDNKKKKEKKRKRQKLSLICVIPSSDADPDSILREERGGVGRATSSSSSVE